MVTVDVKNLQGSSLTNYEGIYRNRPMKM